jgi:transposase
MPTYHRVTLTDAERASLTELTRRGTAKARDVRRAQALLCAARGQTDAAIGAAVGVHPRTIARWRERAVTPGVAQAIVDRPRPGAPRLLDTVAEAALIATACSDAPDGHARWTVRLLADRLVALEVVPSVSYETVRRVLKKTSSNPGASNTGVCRT